ncbi:MAG: hypothetical protein ACOYOK_06290, partial [Pseudobdellovibrionaceae bacterium]
MDTSDKKINSVLHAKNFKTILSSAILLLAGLAGFDAKANSPRPPQFVLLAFDGSNSIPFWQESLAFAQQSEANGFPLKFTYFISGVYFLGYDTYQTYDAPGLGRGKSSIGFSGFRTDSVNQQREEILSRTDQVNDAFTSGQEIASHANGHFDANRPSFRGTTASAWKLADWDYEFRQFNDLIFNVFSINKLDRSTKYPRGWTFNSQNITGFRAPLLGVNEGLWPALVKNGFKYDTS